MLSIRWTNQAAKQGHHFQTSQNIYKHSSLGSGVACAFSSEMTVRKMWKPFSEHLCGWINARLMMVRKQNPTNAGNETWNNALARSTLCYYRESSFWKSSRPFLYESQAKSIKWIYRLNHVGIRGNESADLLAGNATLDSTEMIRDSRCNQGSHGYIAEWKGSLLGQCIYTENGKYGSY